MRIPVTFSEKQYLVSTDPARAAEVSGAITAIVTEKIAKVEAGALRTKAGRAKLDKLTAQATALHEAVPQVLVDVAAAQAAWDGELAAYGEEAWNASQARLAAGFDGSEAALDAAENALVLEGMRRVRNDIMDLIAYRRMKESDGLSLMGWIGAFRVEVQARMEDILNGQYLVNGGSAFSRAAGEARNKGLRLGVEWARQFDERVLTPAAALAGMGGAVNGRLE